MSDLIISVSGLRGVVGATLTPGVALRYAAAFATELPAGPVILARDGRPSGPMLASAIEAGLCGLGRRVLRAGVAATPTVGVLVRQHAAAGALQISASHNPPPYNGIKLFGGDGRVLSAAAGARVAHRYRDPTPIDWRAFDGVGDATTLDETSEEHLRLVLATVDAERIRRRRFRVLLDANHGAGSLLGTQLLESLGCDVHVLGGLPDGWFSHPPEPTADNLVSVGREVQAAGADVGFCQDPDADRLAVLDEAGRYLGEEYTLALCVRHRLEQQRGPVVVNCATSRMSQDLAEQAGVRLIRSAVGEANVADAMLSHEAVYGGEGNGGPIDPRVGYVRDSFVGMAQILDAMAARELPVSRLAGELPGYAIHKTKTEVSPADLPVVFAGLSERFADAAASLQDGLRLDWADRWLLVRGSNTEPIVRIITEARDEHAARRLADEAAGVIRRIVMHRP